MLKEIKYNSDINWGRRFRKYIIDELIRKNILKTDFTELEYIHKVLSSEWTVDRDYPASWNKLRRVLQDEINFTERVTNTMNAQLSSLRNELAVLEAEYILTKSKESEKKIKTKK